MKIKLKIRETAEAKGIKTAYQLQKKAGLVPSTAYRLFNNQASHITLETLERICTALDCDPGVLIVRGDKTVRAKKSRK